MIWHTITRTCDVTEIRQCSLLLQVCHWCYVIYWGCASETHCDVIKWKHLPRYWPFERGTSGHRCIPLTKASDAGLWCFLWSASEQTVEWTIETPVNWNAIALMVTSLLCHVKLKCCEISSSITYAAVVKLFIILHSHRIWQWCRRTLYKISKRLGKWETRYSRTWFRRIWG